MPGEVGDGCSALGDSRHAAARTSSALRMLGLVQRIRSGSTCAVVCALALTFIMHASPAYIVCHASKSITFVRRPRMKGVPWGIACAHCSRAAMSASVAFIAASAIAVLFSVRSACNSNAHFGACQLAAWQYSCVLL